MRYTKVTVAVAAAGAGVICLAPAAAAEETAPEADTATAPSVSQVEPCFRVRGIIPCVRVGVPVVPEARIVDENPPEPVSPGDGSAPVS